ncbi:armadillo-type protein [Bombardia bombarda]|uniref:Nucleolar protein 9 n=1 Tax=Bombardia bombarda TaxID=252184 RepID=A0AA39X132_9PEZI|nr:armadillo-type protein [Bombardia bombarda]
MGKARKSKRQLVRDEKRAKKREREGGGADDSSNEQQQQDYDQHTAKRQRRAAGDDAPIGAGADYIPLDDNYDGDDSSSKPLIPRGDMNGAGFEREFFGMLADQEQEYFRHADELLELNDFPTPEERDMFLQNVYREARGKELKLASSQSCSRLMERLILLSSTKQKKHLFDAFAGHFISMVTHMFAGHCCEKLFLQSAPVVTMELAGLVEEEVTVEGEEEEEEEEEDGEATKMSMEALFLATLDEFEGHLSYLLSDRYGSHALRALLAILSGRPLDKVATKSLLQSKKKEYITVEGAAARTSELSSQQRAVPESFNAAIKKIIADITESMDATALRVLATHPTGNPTLQLLLELEFQMAAKAKKETKKKDGKKDKFAEKEAEPEVPEPTTLLEKLIPGAPATFSDENSQASEFVNSMLYNPIGSRLLETLITHCPGKIFKGLQAHFFGPRIHSLLRNDIASYPAIQVLNRLSKEDLADAIDKSLEHMPVFVDKGRFNVIKTLFERCSVRGAADQIGPLLKSLTTVCGGDWKHVIPKLCFLNNPTGKSDDKKKEKFDQDAPKNMVALVSHGSQLVSALLAIPGPPAKAIQQSLLSLSPDQLLRMATGVAPTANILVKALATPSHNPNFHKILVAALRPHAFALATSQQGHNVINAIISAPSKGEDGVAVPFHLKQVYMAALEEHEAELRETWLGRNVWRTWRGDLWKNRRYEWVRWAKGVDPEGKRVSRAPEKREKEAEEEGKDRGKINITPTTANMPRSGYEKPASVPAGQASPPASAAAAAAADPAPATTTDTNVGGKRLCEKQDEDEKKGGLEKKAKTTAAAAAAVPSGKQPREQQK